MQKLREAAAALLDSRGFLIHRKLAGTVFDRYFVISPILSDYFPSFIPILGIEDGVLGLYLAKDGDFIVDVNFADNDGLVFGSGDRAILEWAAERLSFEPTLVQEVWGVIRDNEINESAPVKRLSISDIGSKILTSEQSTTPEYEEYLRALAAVRVH